MCVVIPGLKFLKFEDVSKTGIDNHVTALSDCIWTGGKFSSIKEVGYNWTFVNLLQRFNCTLPFYSRLCALLPQQPKPISVYLE